MSELERDQFLKYHIFCEFAFEVCSLKYFFGFHSFKEDTEIRLLNNDVLEYF